ncbi:aconitate hydratase AcnA [Collinsella sp. AGMB00827]|uniref:Aconitate hydratase n=1 Tax=Collinsella ureilytica TaxID=2869515 RepID=A0ABS7ML37_9ACTN|nr:aconitate hydratase AcnA [Collinsella urealyticum]MBY4798074.1 aconitate hydratase AcnA [Collinsella urealyticum]
MATKRMGASELVIDNKKWTVFLTSALEGADTLPVSLQVLIENVLRTVSDPDRAISQARAIVEAGLAGVPGPEIEFMPSRVLFQDFTGVPVFVDFAAMRDAAKQCGGDPELVNPRIPCTLVVDHSVTADCSSVPDAAEQNARLELERNTERFSFLKWSAKSFDEVKIVPPGVGICHQLNVEQISRVVLPAPATSEITDALGFDTVVGTDSHTTTVNGIGVLGWGVGGIEAEAAALGQPISMRVPRVIGIKLTGKLAGGATAMDLALELAYRLRAIGVVGCLLECTGPGVRELTATQRATVANMTPEYGATATFFPPDEAVLDQLALTGTDEDDIRLVREYLKAQGLLSDPDHERVWSELIEVDLSEVTPSLAGPSRPHNRVSIADLPKRFEESLKDHGRTKGESFSVHIDKHQYELGHGAIAIAAITSCTTATDPAMMIAAGLAAARACELGVYSRPWVKKIFAPGSHATTSLLARAGLLEPLARQGFDVCGYGCMSCIGNSGPLLDGMEKLAATCELTSVLSGNRNFDGRISPDVAQNYLAAPALVFAYALAGTVDRNLELEPLGEGNDGPVFLRDLLPTDAEVEACLQAVLDPLVFQSTRLSAQKGSQAWQDLPEASGSTFPWDPSSTYVRRPPYFEQVQASDRFSITDAACLAYLGDFITTDHISPAGAIGRTSPAAQYLRERGYDEASFNTYGSRRGNHEIMMRGTFANVRLQNKLAQGKLGGWTLDPISKEIVSIYDAAVSATEAGRDLVIIAGKMYGSGSSRDWAAKGPALLGVRAVIAESFERIHRSNLIGMGIVPLQFMPHEDATTIGLTGLESFTIEPVDVGRAGRSATTTRVVARQGETQVSFEVRVCIDTPTEALYLGAGGILPFVLQALLVSNASEKGA